MNVTKSVVKWRSVSLVLLALSSSAQASAYIVIDSDVRQAGSRHFQSGIQNVTSQVPRSLPSLFALLKQVNQQVSNIDVAADGQFSSLHHQTGYSMSSLFRSLNFLGSDSLVLPLHLKPRSIQGEAFSIPGSEAFVLTGIGLLGVSLSRRRRMIQSSPLSAQSLI